MLSIRKILPLFVLCLLAGGAGAWLYWREGCRLTLNGHTGPVRALAASASGKLLASGGQDHKVCLWSLPSGRQTQTFTGHSAPVTALAVSPDETRIASAGTDGIIKVWNSESGTEGVTLPGHKGGTGALVFEADGKTLFSAGADRAIRRWDLTTGKLLVSVREHSTAVAALALSADGQVLVSAGGGDHAVRVWKLPLRSSSRVLRGHAHRVQALIFAGQEVISADRAGNVKVWDLVNGREVRSFEAHPDRVVGLAAVGDRLVTACEDRGLASWSQRDLNLPPVRRKQAAPIETMIGIPGGVATAGMDGRVRIWDLPTG